MSKNTLLRTLAEIQSAKLKVKHEIARKAGKPSSELLAFVRAAKSLEQAQIQLASLLADDRRSD